VIGITISVILFLLLPLIIIIKSVKKIINHKININSFSISLILFILLFSPLIIKQNPGYYGNIGVTKLKEPFAEINIIHLKKDYQNKLIEKRDKLLKYDLTNVIFCDNYLISDQIIYFQKGIKYYLNKSEIEFIGNNPKIEKKIFLAGTDEFGRDNWARLIIG